MDEFTLVVWYETPKNFASLVFYKYTQQKWFVWQEWYSEQTDIRQIYCLL